MMSAVRRAGRFVTRLSHAAKHAALTEGQTGASTGRTFSSAASGAAEGGQSSGVEKWGVPAFAAAAIGAGAYYYNSRSGVVQAERNVPENSAHLNANDVKTGSAPEEPVQIPDFTATDQLGNEVSLEQIKGEFAMLCFGATRDVDEAKSRLENLTEIVRQSDRKSNMQYMRALFVSEEPEKEAPEKMAGLLSEYKIQSERRKKGPRILGLTGSDVTKMREMVNKFNQQVMSEGKTEVVHESDPDGTLFLINPDGQLVAGFKYAAHGVDTRQVTNAIAQEILAYTHSHPQWHSPKKIGRRSA